MEVDDLLREPGWTEDAAIGDQLPAPPGASARYYRHTDGRMLVVSSMPRLGFSATVYPDDAHVRRGIKAARELGVTGPRTVLDGLFPYGRDFPQHVNQLTATLAEAMECDPGLLDGSLESLERVDTFINDVGRIEIFGPDPDDSGLFPALVAYTGSVIANFTDGHHRVSSAL